MSAIIIGDCHTLRLAENSDFNVWARHGFKMIDFVNSEDILNLKSHVSFIPEEYLNNKKDIPDRIPFSASLNYDTIIFWLGYVEVKEYLPGHSDERINLVVGAYLEKIKNLFPDKKIIIIEPLPQFEELVYVYPVRPDTEEKVLYTYAERDKASDRLINSIKTINTMNENFQIIPRCEIYKSLNVSSLNSDMMYFEESVNKKIDALSPENYAVIASMLKEKI
jgi:hypothetical protein